MKPSLRILCWSPVMCGSLAAAGFVCFKGWRHTRADRRLERILDNLRQIDEGATQFCMESSRWKGMVLTRSQLDGTGPNPPPPYVRWPSGPIPGIYSVSECGVMATFNGGARGAMNRTQWIKQCGPDPASCGL